MRAHDLRYADLLSLSDQSPIGSGTQISAEERKSFQRYADLFNSRDWDGLRAEVTAAEDLRADAGFADGVPVIAVYRPGSTRPAYFIRLGWNRAA